MMALSRDAMRSSREGLGLGEKGCTENVQRLPKRVIEGERVRLKVLQEVDPIDVERPRTRGDCIDGPRPCPWVGCKHNLFFDVSRKNGSIKHNFGWRELDEIDPNFSCSLDVADRGGATLEDIAKLSNVVRERIRQIEAKALEQVKRRSKTLREFSDAPEGAPIPTTTTEGSVLRPGRDVGVEREEVDPAQDTSITRISFFAESEKFDAPLSDGAAWDAVLRADELVANRVWTMFAKDSNARGFEVVTRSQLAAREAKTPWRQPPKKGSKNMSTSEVENLTPRMRGVLSAYLELSRDGARPSNIEIANRAGIEGESESGRGANVSNALSALRKKGLLDTKKSNGAAPPRKSANGDTRKKSSNGHIANGVEARPARTHSKDPTIQALIEKRNSFLTKAHALDTAIEALAVAL